MKYLPLLILLPCAIACHEAMAQQPYTIDWVRQFGGDSEDMGASVTVDSAGEVYVSGRIADAINGNVFLKKYTHQGEEIWTYLSDVGSYSHAVEINDSGFAYISGHGANQQAFVKVIDENGGEIKSHSLFANDYIASYAIAFGNDGSTYITGRTLDITYGPAIGGELNSFLAKFDAAGDVLWSRPVIEDVVWSEGRAIKVDELGNVYVVGLTVPNAYYGDAFIAKFTSDGDDIWQDHLRGELWEEATDVSILPNGTIIIAGDTSSSLFSQNSSGNGISHIADSFFQIYDSEGNKLLSKQFGTTLRDETEAMTVGSEGNIFVAGTRRSIDYQSRSPFISMLNETGKELWTLELDLGNNARINDIKLDDDGNIYVTGGVENNQKDEKNDVFLMKLIAPNTVPEPSTLVLLLVVFSLMSAKNRSNL